MMRKVRKRRTPGICGLWSYAEPLQTEQSWSSSFFAIGVCGVLVVVGLCGGRTLHSLFVLKVVGDIFRFVLRVI